MDNKNIKASVIFVCTGNTCRSPMAEAMFKDFLKARKLGGDFSVSSAGLLPEKGSTMSENASRVLEMLGVKHDPHRKARTFTVQMSMDADLVVAMSEAHAVRTGSEYAVSFEELIGAPIPDPYGGNFDEYLFCAETMRRAFDRILGLLDARLEQKKADGDGA